MTRIQNTVFTFEPGTDVDTRIALLRRAYPVHTFCETQLERQYLDSFDWRLYRKNLECSLEVTAGLSRKKSKVHEAAFSIRDKSGGIVVCACPVQQIPRFAADVTAPKCRKLLHDALDIRALMTVATVNVDCRQLTIRNADHKAVAIVRLESFVLIDPAIAKRGDQSLLTGRLTVAPVRGYWKIAKQVTQTIIDQWSLPSYAGTTPLDEILTVTDRRPDTTWQEHDKLSDTLNTWEAVRLLLLRLFAVMRANEPGLRAAIDTEFLHDYRVAVRRTRSLLGQIKRILPARQLDYFKREFSWLGQVTGPTRDLDIYLLKFDAYRRELSKSMQKQITPLREFLERHWAIEQARLCRQLDSKRYQKLVVAWRDLLEDAVGKQSNQPPHKRLHNAVRQQTANAEKPARTVAGKSIWRLYRRVISDGNAITALSPDADLHDLRKTCKKFRYLIEFFRDFYPDESIRRLLKILKQYQENLGDFQDLCIQTAQLNHFAEQMQQEGLADTQTIMAMGVLVEKLNQRKRMVRAEFEQRFKAFAAPESEAVFVGIFNPEINTKA